MKGREFIEELGDLLETAYGWCLKAFLAFLVLVALLVIAGFLMS